MTKKERVLQIKQVFDVVYFDASCSLDYSNTLELLIATQLSAQCTDARVNIVTKTLFAKYKTASEYANAKQEDIENIIHSTGFFRNKAKNIILCCKRLVEHYNSTVPDNMDDLLSLAGTGRKTANLILGDAFGEPSLVIDTHAIRITNLIGLVKESDPVKIEFALKKIVPSDYQTKFCHQLVYHGRKICIARRPKCDICPILHLCNGSKIDKIPTSR